MRRIFYLSRLISPIITIYLGEKHLNEFPEHYHIAQSDLFFGEVSVKLYTMLILNVFFEFDNFSKRERSA